MSAEAVKVQSAQPQGAKAEKPKAKIDAVKLKKYGGRYTIGIFRWLFIIGICFVILYPLISKICSSFFSIQDMYDPTVHYIPKNPTFDNYETALARLGYPTTLINTFTLSLLAGILQTASATLVGYGFARYKFKGRSFLFALVIIALVAPPYALLLPRFVMFSNIGLLNTYIPTILMGVTGTGLKCSLYIFIMRQFFRGMPKELEEAAYVDGAGPVRTFIVIMLPSAVSMMVTCFLFSFVWQWLDTMYAQTFMADVRTIATSIGYLRDTAGQGLVADTQLGADLIKNAGIVIIILPLLVLYAFTQRFFVESIARSGLVG